MDISPMFLIDGYKASHKTQYLEGVESIYSNFTARAARDPEMDFIVVFGIQGFSKEILIEEWGRNFFQRPLEEVVKDYQELMDAYLGLGRVSADHIRDLHNLGYLPVHLKSLQEGTVCPLRIPVFTIVNTRPEFFWLTNYLETVLSCYLWQPMTSATQAFIYRRILEQFAKETSDIPDFVPWQIHDFSMRGQTSPESAMRSGAGHLLSAYGTDTVPALPYLKRYYGADYRKELVGGSVAATEHSCASSSIIMIEEELRTKGEWCGYKVEDL